MSSQGKPRPKIGIITGSGPEAGVDLWQRLLAANRRRLGAAYTGDWDAPDVTLVSVPELGYSMELEERHEEVWATLRGAAERLASQVDVYAIACNTLNFFEDRLRELGLPATLITPAEAVNAELRREPADSVALLGSRQTMDLGSWSSYRSLGAHARIELPADAERLHALIYAVKQAGGSTPDIAREFGALLDGLESDAAVLACTELPLITLAEERQRPRLLDATELLAQELLAWQHPQGDALADEGTDEDDAAVLVVYAGGTFGMRDNGNGLENVGDIRHEVDELMAGVNAARHRSLAWEFVVAARVDDSAEADGSTASLLAATIRAHAQTSGCRGVVLVHGTDTLAYNAARLAFELDDLGMAVVCTGSQIPLHSDGSDAPRNFADAVQAAVGGVPAGTWIAFGGRTLPALRATKRSSESPSGFVAHRPVGANPVGVPEGVLAAVRQGDAGSRTPVGLVKVTPGLSPAVLSAAFDAHPRGVVLECYGAGTAPAFVAAVAGEAVAKGGVVLAVTQCEDGPVHLDRYAVGAALARAGVIDGGDLTTEAALAKLGVLIDAELDPDEIAEMLAHNFAGERQPLASAHARRAETDGTPE